MYMTSFADTGHPERTHRRRREDTEAGPREHSDPDASPGERLDHGHGQRPSSDQREQVAPGSGDHSGFVPDHAPPHPRPGLEALGCGPFSTDTVNRPGEGHHHYTARAYQHLRRALRPRALARAVLINTVGWVLAHPHYLMTLVPLFFAAQMAIWFVLGNKYVRDPDMACQLPDSLCVEEYYDRICPTRFSCSIGVGGEAFWRGFALAMRVDLPQTIFLSICLWIVDTSGPLSSREKALRALLVLLPLMSPFWHGLAFFTYSRENFCPRIYDPGDEDHWGPVT